MRPIVLASLLTLAFAGSAQAASFDCGRARTADEKAICADRSLNDQDVRMAQLLQITQHLVPMGTRGAIQDAQVQWLAGRRKCGANRACLARSYGRRIAELNSVLETRVYNHGPF